MKQSLITQSIFRFVRFGLAGLALSILLSGCGTSAHYIEPDGPEALISLSGVDPAEWGLVAGRVAESLISSGALQRQDGQRSVVMIGRIRNYTMQHLEIGILSAKLRQTLLVSQQTSVTSAVGSGCNIDLSVRRIRLKELDELFDSRTVPKNGTVIAPNFSLSGTIVQQMNYAGRTEENYFLFHLVLTDLVTGIAVWEDNVEFAKQATHPIL